MRSTLLIATTFMCLTPVVARGQAYGDPNSLVDHWYRNYLGRAPDSGMTTWVNELVQGIPPDQVLSTILGGDEYYQRAGTTPEGFIARLYNDCLNRQPTASELDFWVRRMYTSDRGSIAHAILTQNPGVWVSPGAAVIAPVPLTPSVPYRPPVVTPGVEWHRDWHSDWDRHHDIHDYRRPDVHRAYEYDEHHH